MNLIKSVVENHDVLRSWRQKLHQNPEIAYQERETSDFVAITLESFGIEVHRGFGGTGLVGVIEGNTKSSRAIGLRADMDALPLTEQTNLPYASRNEGKMHACGHDGHTTMLLGAAQHLARTRDFSGTVYVIFQPAEEGGNAGARAMINDGLFQTFKMESVWGIHNWPGLKVGQTVVHSGAAMAGADIFILTIDGKGGHAALPHQSNDPVVAAGMVIVALQTLTSRRLDPFDQTVISLTRLDAGSAFNVIPAFATVGGTLRTMKSTTRESMLAEIEQVALRAASTLGCTVSMEIRQGYPPTVNHKSEAAFASDLITGFLGDEAVNTTLTPAMAAEDFSFMMLEKPGAYIWLGAGTESEFLHSPYFDFNDELLPIGASLWVNLAHAKLS